MPNRRAFLSLIVLGVAATGMVHAGTGRAAAVSRSGAIVATAPRPAMSADATRRAWDQVVSTYRAILGPSGMQLFVLPDSPTIEGIQDGPDGVDPLGIKGFKGLTPKYNEEEEPPPPLP